MAFYGLEINIKRNSYDPVSLTAIGEHIKKRRIQLHLLQKDIAKILEVSEDTITYWENGRATPQISHYPKIIRFLGYNPFPVDTSTLSGRMKKYRVENGVSQDDLGKLVGVNESTIFSWEKGEHMPLPNKLKLLEEIIYSKELS